MAPGRLDEAGGNTLHAAKDEIVTKRQRTSGSGLSREHDHVLRTYRILIADLCQQFNMGHPGYAKE